MICFNDFKDAERVFYYFEEISKIPHGSGNTAHIADYLVSFAENHGLSFYRDESNNVLIRKPATNGLESRPTVIIQGHTDMVAEKLPDLDKDMQTEGLEIYRDGDFLRARGTTLGGDDGVAVAYALALLESKDIPHPAIEALFTSDEETGLIGATALDPSVLDGRIMINIDSDDEGIFTVGCAGGARTDISFAVNRESFEGKRYSLKVGGLLGGHSGVEIHKMRGNASKLLATILSELGDIRIAAILGGNMDNAITREAEAEFVTNSSVTEAFTRAAERISTELERTDPNFYAELTECESELIPLDSESTARLLSIMGSIHSGVVATSGDIEGLVESSQNIGIVRLDEKFRITTSVRSAKGESKKAMIANLREIAQKNGAEVSVRGEYPAWEYRPESHLRDVCCKVYSDMYGKNAEVIVIHAGLECGIFSDKIEGLDCISIGPDNFDIHTTEEHLSISSTARVWEFLKNILKEI